MTRVNLVRVEDLADQHLFAEWREIKMVPAKIRKLQDSIATGNRTLQEILYSIPGEYMLGTGHVRFFYNKMIFLADRYLRLTDELKKRKYNISPSSIYTIFYKDIAADFADYYTPTTQDIQQNIKRIAERLHQRPEWYRYHGEIKSPEFFIERYNHQLLAESLS